MERLAIVLGLVLLTVLAVLKLVQLLQWSRCTATIDGAQAGSLAFTYTGQKLPIIFRTKDGALIQAKLRTYSKGAIPPPGAPLRILYDPDEPARAEWASSLLVLAAIAAILVAATMSVVAGMLA